MKKGKGIKARSRQIIEAEEFWYDPMSYPAFMKKRDDKKTPII